MSTEPDFSAQIARGMAWLDEHRPGWVERIDLDTFDMGRCARCALGQTLPPSDDDDDPYDGWDDGADQMSDAQIVARGFDIIARQHPNNRVAYDALTAQWKTAILARRASVPA